MKQKLDESMTVLSYPKYSVESDWMYISKNQFIWNGDVYQVNSDKTVEKLPNDVSPEFDLDIICGEHEKLLNRLLKK